jgi:hypothetical protein
MDENKGRCVSCGFLAKCTTDLYRRPIFYELLESERETFRIIFPKEKTASTMMKVAIHLTCYRGVTTFGESRSAYDTSNNSEFFNLSADEINELKGERNCPKWFSHSPNIDPQKTWDEMKMFEFEERGQQFQKWLETERQERNAEASTSVVSHK